MKKMSEPIVFFGSGPVAAKSLELLLKSFEVEAVITKPRPPHHKGSVPVLDMATAHNLKVYTAADRASLDALFDKEKMESRLAVLIDFGIIVSQKVIDYFPFGIVNSHFSLLPEWRGADPITFAILSGKENTGVSLMLLTAGMDEGPLLGQTRATITKKMTTPELTELLISQSYEALVRTLPSYLSGDVKPTPQESVTLARSITPSYSRKLSKGDGIINWQKSAEEIEREVRAFIGWPQSRTSFAQLEVIITESHVLRATGKPGSRAIIDKTPVVFCKTGALAIDKLKPVGKKEMTGQSFLAGYKAIFTGEPKN